MGFCARSRFARWHVAQDLASVVADVCEGDFVAEAVAEPVVVLFAHVVADGGAAVHVYLYFLQTQFLHVWQQGQFGALWLLCAWRMVFDNDPPAVGLGWEDYAGCEEAHLGEVGDVHVLQLGAFEEHEAPVILETLVCGDERVEAGAPEGLYGIGVELLDLHCTDLVMLRVRRSVAIKCFKWPRIRSRQQIEEAARRLELSQQQKQTRRKEESNA